MNSNPDIVVITEHNMKYDEINRLKLNGYMYTKLCLCKRKYKNGEVMIMYKKGLKIKNINLKTEKNISDKKQFEFTGNKYNIL